MKKETSKPVFFYYKSGKIQSKEYFLDKKHHRTNGPASIFYYEFSGKIQTEIYWVRDKAHRVNKPAIIDYYPSGQVSYESYCIKDKNHRLDGPARIDYDESGKIESEEYWINDTHLNKFEKYGKEKIFEYIKEFPQFIKEIEILARHNNWLNENQILLIKTMNVFL